MAGEHQQDMRLDAAAAVLFPEYSRTRLQHWIKTGNLLVDGREASLRTRVCQGMSMHLYCEAEVQTTWQPQNIALSIVYEDEQILVIDKAAGMVVHPAAGNPDGTLLNALLHHCLELEAIPRAGIIHRLDKDTSGLLVIAKTLSSHNELSKQLLKRKVNRYYLALACGQMTAPGSIDAPIARHPVKRKKMAVVASGRPRAKPALTHYKPLQLLQGYTVLEVRLETGRTHQIRVHLAHSRHPLLGDPVYGGNQKLVRGINEEAQQALNAFRRQALHAWKLSFSHPETRQEVTFKSPIPEDMAEIIRLLSRT